MTAFASVKLGGIAKSLAGRRREMIPAFQMPRADFALYIAFVARSHPQQAALHFGSVSESEKNIGRRS